MQSNTSKSVLLVYDIPSDCKMSNPSSRLRAYGFRVNLSCWIIPEHRVPWKYLESWPNSVRREIVRFDIGEEKKLRELARDALNREAGQIRSSMEKSMEKAVAKLEAAEAAYAKLEVEEKEVTKKQRAVKALIKYAAKQLRQAEEAAMGFEILAEVSEAYNATRLAIAAQQAAYFAEVDAAVVSSIAQVPVAASEAPSVSPEADSFQRAAEWFPPAETPSANTPEVESTTLDEESLAALEVLAHA